MEGAGSFLPVLFFFSFLVTGLGRIWWPGEGIVAVDNQDPWQVLFGVWPFWTGLFVGRNWSRQMAPSD